MPLLTGAGAGSCAAHRRLQDAARSLPPRVPPARGEALQLYGGWAPPAGRAQEEDHVTAQRRAAVAAARLLLPPPASPLAALHLRPLHATPRTPVRYCAAFLSLAHVKCTYSRNTLLPRWPVSHRQFK